MAKLKSDTELGKFISLILRHDPSAIGIELDPYGWADINELINGINKADTFIDLDTLERIVLENNKQRYSYNDDHTKIRANQGHSLPVDAELKKAVPPKILYHGTAERFLDSILKTGLNKQSRQYVHLSSDQATAVNVGRRHGKVVVLSIDAALMVKDGYSFFLSANHVWLCEEVPIKYIQLSGE